MHGSYWESKNPPRENETFDSGYPDEVDARACLDQLSDCGYTAVMRHEETIEHDVPTDSPQYRAENDRNGRRWCVYLIGYAETNEAAGEGG